MHLLTDVLDQEYYQLKQILSSSSIPDHDIGQRLVNIENKQQRSLIDQQRIQTLEHLVNKFYLPLQEIEDLVFIESTIENELNAMKLDNDSLRRRLNSTCEINIKNASMLPKNRHNRSYSTLQKSWPFPCFPPWIRPKLPSVLENKPLENPSLLT